MKLEAHEFVKTEPPYYKLTPDEEAEVLKRVSQELQVEAVIRGLAQNLGVEVSPSDEEEELLKDKERSGATVKQLRKFYRYHPIESNRKYLSVLGKKVIKKIKAG